jgi:hypothetical protein
MHPSSPKHTRRFNSYYGRSSTTANDHTIVGAFAKRWGNHSSFKSGAADGSGFPTFAATVVITTAPSLILPKDSWIEIWMLLTLISSLCFEVLLMDWKVRVLSPM